ncbi:MAG: 3-oxoacyl-[acyl-carrier-protein] synthase 2 [Legionellaceae bacterium]
MSKRRVVVTGLGLITSLGLTVKETWENILKGRSGVSLVETFDTTKFSTKISSSVKNFDSTQFISSKDARKLDIFAQYGVAAACEAIRDANFSVTEENASRIGISIGSGIGGLPMIEKTTEILANGGPRKISPFFIPASIINMIAGYISIQYGFKGPNIAIATACTTGTHSIGHAARMIAYGDADAMLAGGTEMATSPVGLGGFSACRALSTRNDEPARASRPWDKDRDGFVLGDGAGIIMLEEYESAKRRGASIYAELIGFGMSADAYHMTAPHPEGEGAYNAMLNAIRDAGINKDAVDYINAHGTSTQVGDELEAIAIKRAFGEHAYQLAVSSTKSMTGHLLGAAGAIEAIFSILALRDQIAPPTINLENPSEGCDLNFVPNTAQPMPIDTVLSNSFGFGGTNGAVLFRKV